MIQPISHKTKVTEAGVVTGGSSVALGIRVDWQDGPLVEKTDNPEYPLSSVPPSGAFLQTLVQICIERLQQYQESSMRSRENAVALTHLETAQLWLGKREAERSARGVLGTHEK